MILFVPSILTNLCSDLDAIKTSKYGMGKRVLAICHLLNSFILGSKIEKLYSYIQFGKGIRKPVNLLKSSSTCALLQHKGQNTFNLLNSMNTSNKVKVLIVFCASPHSLVLTKNIPRYGDMVFFLIFNGPLSALSLGLHSKLKQF